MSGSLFDVIMNCGLSALLAYAVVQLSRQSAQITQLNREKFNLLQFKHGIDLMMKKQQVIQEQINDREAMELARIQAEAISQVERMDIADYAAEHSDEAVQQNHEFVRHLMAVTSDEDTKQ